jgi:hypothetical protein
MQAVRQLFKRPWVKTDSCAVVNTQYLYSPSFVQQCGSIISKIIFHSTWNGRRAISVEDFTVEQVINVENVISRDQLDSFDEIAGLLHHTVVNRQLVGHTGSITTLQGLQPEELGMVLLAGTHFEPEPSRESQQYSGTFADFANTFCNETTEGGNKATTLLENKASVRYIRGLRWAATHRRLFPTSYGSFGLGPRAMHEGDRMVVLSA